MATRANQQSPGQRLPAGISACHSCIRRLLARVHKLKTQLAALQAENERLRRCGKRQAAPFSKEKRVQNPQKPGRKPGKGPFTRRAAPDPETITRRVRLPLTDSACPHCGGPLLPDGVEVATTTDLPPTPRPEVIAYQRQCCRCVGCGRRVQASHPDLPDDQRGATAHRLGPRIRGLAHWLHYGCGVPVRKLPVILETMTGIRVTQSALTQDALRQADGKLGQFYQQTGAAIGRAPAVFTDDTSWKTAGEVAFLMVFVTDQFVYFQIRPRHRNQEVREVLPADYPGTLITDRGRSYDAQELAEVRQQKCLAHLLRSLSEGLKTQRGRSRSLGLSLQRVLRQALGLWGRYRQGEAPNFAAEKARLNAELDELLARRRTGNHLNQRWLDDFGPRNRRGELLRFLDFPDLLEPTNNRAERALRPAVIQRKVSHCSKNARGAAAQAIFATLFATLQLREAPSMLEAALAAFATGILPPEV